MQAPVKPASTSTPARTWPGDQRDGVIKPVRTGVVWPVTANHGLDLEASETMRPQPFSLVGDSCGSIFKIFTTAAALDMGMGGNLRRALIPGQRSGKLWGKGTKRAWCVVNAGNYRGSMNVTALATSPNTAFISFNLTEVRGGACGRYGHQTRAEVHGNQHPCTDHNPTAIESLADFVKQQNLGRSRPHIELNALELSNVAATLAVRRSPPSNQPAHRAATAAKSRSPPNVRQVVPAELANTLANAMMRRRGRGATASSAGAAGWDL